MGMAMCGQVGARLSRNSSTCTFPVTVLDTDVPKSLSPEKVIVRNIEAGTCGAKLNFDVPLWTNCLDATLVCRDETGRMVDSNSIFQVGTHTITRTASDTAGNSFTCSFTLVVNEWQKPDIDCPGDITRTVAPGVTEPSIALPNLVVTDNCPGATFTCERDEGLAQTAPFKVGTTIATCTVMDAAGSIRNCFYRVHVKVDIGS